ncbi:hypothetical protein HPB51_022581 [Rhipicephalus microplus]|uniref:Uncharacterized protein n=1 Tax=Rhipicephalus microplus TaxID=6941 RepID=A0A9J6DX37_RHIMP|nr:hypothetical protein HPB51_022581 [Rhipicephalus microplus]
MTSIMTAPSADLDISKYTGSVDDRPVQDMFNLFEFHAAATSWSERQRVTNFTDYVIGEAFKFYLTHIFENDEHWKIVKQVVVHGSILRENHRGRPTLKDFTFSSDVPASLLLDMIMEVGFNTCLQICANVTYSQSHFRKYSCTQLADLVSEHGGADFPPRLVLLAIYQPEHLTQQISNASEMANWTSVSHLCLVLVPLEPESTHYSTLGAEFFPCLHEFFVRVARNLQELNVNSFHFGLGLDLTKVLLYVNIKTLRALSTSPCGLHHPSALQCLVSGCPGLNDLDVRVYRKVTWYTALFAKARLSCTTTASPYSVVTIFAKSSGSPSASCRA